MSLPYINEIISTRILATTSSILQQSQITITLRNSILYAQSISENDQNIQTLRNESSACLALIEANVAPIKADLDEFRLTVFRAFLGNGSWGQSSEVKKLFYAFVKSGYIRVDEALPASDFSPQEYKHGALPLEAAVVAGNQALFGELLKNGADITKVPGKAYSVFQRVANREVNIFTFIDLHRQDEIGQVFASKLKEFIMRRQLNQAAPVQCTAESLSVTRRMMAV